jgi:hypothetical protein
LLRWNSTRKRTDLLCRVFSTAPPWESWRCSGNLVTISSLILKCCFILDLSVELCSFESECTAERVRSSVFALRAARYKSWPWTGLVLCWLNSGFPCLLSEWRQLDMERAPRGIGSHYWINWHRKWDSQRTS